MTIQELSDEMRKKKARCDRYCGTWNREDRDCEIYRKKIKNVTLSVQILMMNITRLVLQKVISMYA